MTLGSELDIGIVESKLLVEGKVTVLTDTYCKTDTTEKITSPQYHDSKKVRLKCNIEVDNAEHLQWNFHVKN